ncbi:hypothetical protein HKX48_001619 [Thoreauomyces humboldtii]|nr:hypothetical protein HKX48_001619 [Thoreauomyces humboldtii]
MAELKAMCDQPVLLIETEGGGDESMAAVNQYEGCVAGLLRLGVMVLFSSSADETAQLLYTLAEKEASEGASMEVPDLLPVGGKRDDVERFLMSIPGVSDVTALAIVDARFRSVREFINW